MKGSIFLGDCSHFYVNSERKHIWCQSLLTGGALILRCRPQIPRRRKLAGNYVYKNVLPNI